VDEDTLNMLLTLDRPPPDQSASHHTLVEKRDAPYSHQVFKSGNLDLKTESPQKGTSHCQPPFSEQAEGGNLVAVPLDHASAFFGKLLTEYHSSLCASSRAKGSPKPNGATAADAATSATSLATEGSAEVCAAHWKKDGEVIGI
jgi:hypothetical protein